MTTTFSTEQVDTLRASFATISTVHTSKLADFHKLFDGCTNEGLVQLATARIKFVSKLAVNACTRRGFSVASIHVLSLVAGGMDIVDALKEACGGELVDQMVEDVYATLRAKAVR